MGKVHIDWRAEGSGGSGAHADVLPCHFAGQVLGWVQQGGFGHAVGRFAHFAKTPCHGREEYNADRFFREIAPLDTFPGLLTTRISVTMKDTTAWSG